MNNNTIKDNAYDYKNSYVAKDMIWKDYVQKANHQARQWPNNWGFLNGKVEDIIVDEKRSAGIPSNEFALDQKKQLMSSPRVIPKTTAGMIGWRSTNTIYQLEKYGPYTKGKQSITKSLKWPKEGCI